MGDELTLENAPAPVPGPPLPGGKVRKLPFKKRGPYKTRKSDPETIRTAKLWLRLTPACRQFVRRFSDAMNIEESLLVYQAVMNYAVLCRHKEVPPPYDPKLAAATPMLPGLGAGEGPKAGGKRGRR